MAVNNIKVGNNIVQAAFDTDLRAFTADDTAIVRSEVNGNYVSFQPGRQINSLNEIVGGQGLIIISKVERFLNFVYAAPILEGLYLEDPIINFIYPGLLTQAEYDALVKDEHTLYNIGEDGTS